METAAILAKRNNAEILALHMLEISDALLINADAEQQEKAVFFIKLAEKRFEEFLDQPYLKNITVTPIVKHFKVFDEISEVAVDHSVDLIVMGSHGSSGLTEIFVGSNTERVVRHSEIPVLVIKSKPENFDLNSVVFACDFSREAIIPYINASRLFHSLDAKLKLLYVNLPGESFKSSNEIEAIIQEFLMASNGNLSKLEDVNYICDFTVEKGILNFAKKINADAVAIPTHGRKGLAHFFEGSISEDIANHADLPVMTFKIKS
jgi:nucleotide-binding universal stress UspA family protein